MSNGVEVIVAGDKSKTAVDRNSVLRVVPSSLNKPMTLAPSTLKNQMILIAPEDSKVGKMNMGQTEIDFLSDWLKDRVTPSSFPPNYRKV